MKNAICLILGILGTSGCSGYAHSPPGTTFPLESAKALNKGEWGVQGEFGGGGQTFGPTIFTAMARARYGLGHDLDLSLEGNAIVLGQRDLESTEDHRGIYSGRIGLKYELQSWIAFTAGLGGGWSAGGGFISPDFWAGTGYFFLQTEHDTASHDDPHHLLR